MSSTVAKQKGATQSGFFSELFRLGLYKPNQGRIVRQVTFISIAILGLVAACEFSNSQMVFDFRRWLDLFEGFNYAVMLVFGMAFVWLAFRAVNYPAFADFLIAVEAEMNKVSWPTRKEMWRSSVVVIFVIFAMAAVLFLFDVIWSKVFEILGIRYIS